MMHKLFLLHTQCAPTPTVLPGGGSSPGLDSSASRLPLTPPAAHLPEKTSEKKVRRGVKRREKGGRGQKGQQAEDRVKETIISLWLTNLTADGSLEAPKPWKGGGGLKRKSRQRPCPAACHQASRAQRAPGQGSKGCPRLGSSAASLAAAAA